MNKRLFTLVVLLILTLIGCSNKEVNDEIDKEKPPKAFIKIGAKTYETKLGTYCWHFGNKGVCVDTAGPVELLKDKQPIKVKRGEEITFIMNYEPKPNKFHVIQINNNNETEIKVENNRFTAPTQKGVFYYSYGVWWMDKKKANVSNGSAFYAFALEVE
ncbi:hypothetical protein ACQKP0_19975 [Heyndrickxia sp. NPDC080065]|uniref:hypothetical protein n=1 Tax=Heyndrickxia sp. NPDC080065 TaxID=3390568 RepID=UPI003D081488